jgi:hypothetical protein
MPRHEAERVVPLHQYNTLYSLWQQALAENNIHERLVITLLNVRAAQYKPEEFVFAFEAALKEFRRLMRPIYAMRKARPRVADLRRG